MYVRRKRFVRRKGSSEGSGYGSWLLASIIESRVQRAAVSVAVVAAVLLAIPATLVALTPFHTMLYRVDPAVYEALSAGYPVLAYVTVKGDADISGVVKVRKVWQFGETKIYKARIETIDQLNDLLGMKEVISIYAAKHFHHPPLHFLDPEAYPFKEKDIDNEFHEAYGPWIGRNVTVAIIDTGIDYTHPDFYDENNKTIIKVLVSVIYRTEDGKPIIWIPYVNGTMEDLLNYDMQLWREHGEPAFLDINGHGTHCAGIIAGRGWASNGKYKGIAPGTYLVVVKAFNREGYADSDACLDALKWVYDNAEKYGIKILSLSWGAAFASDGNDPLSIAVDSIVKDKGVWVFAAAGNEGNFPTTITVPAVARLAFAVGAWDAYYDKVAPFSSLGPTVDMRMKPDFMGAGVFVVSCRSRYASFPSEYMVGEYYVALSGTSMATPAVAAVAADFIEYYRYWHHKEPTREDFIQWVLNNGRHIDFVKDFVTGWGIPVAPHN